jgi:hypothetical protein
MTQALLAARRNYLRAGPDRADRWGGAGIPARTMALHVFVIEVEVKVRFKAWLLQPEKPARSSWAFVVLPASASTKLPTRNALTVDGRINDHAFRAVLQPDGRKSHWLKVTPAMLKGASAAIDEEVTLEVGPSATELETPVPADLRKALAAAPKAKAVWKEISARARRDWITWIVTAKQAETRARRIDNACDMLGGGKRRVCCFDRSGAYSGALGAPRAESRALRAKM